VVEVFKKPLSKELVKELLVCDKMQKPPKVQIVVKRIVFEKFFQINLIHNSHPGIFKRTWRNSVMSFILAVGQVRVDTAFVKRSEVFYMDTFGIQFRNRKVSIKTCHAS